MKTDTQVFCQQIRKTRNMRERVILLIYEIYVMWKIILKQCITHILLGIFVFWKSFTTGQTEGSMVQRPLYWSTLTEQKCMQYSYLLRWVFFCFFFSRVRVKDVPSKLNSTGSPQVSVLIPVLFILDNNNWRSQFNNRRTVKFADDAVVVSRLCENESSHVRQWCDFSDWTFPENQRYGQSLQKTTFTFTF